MCHWSFVTIDSYFSKMMGDFQTRNLQPKKNPISDDYRITGSVLGLGINGKVVECFSKTTNRKCALKVNIDKGYSFIGFYHAFSSFEMFLLWKKGVVIYLFIFYSEQFVILPFLILYHLSLFLWVNFTTNIYSLGVTSCLLRLKKVFNISGNIKK